MSASNRNGATRRRVPPWAVVFAVVFALWLGALLWSQAALRREATFNTGDALLDRYLALAEPNNRLTARAAEKLMSEFAADQRLWELLIALSEHSEYEDEKRGNFWTAPVSELLVRAREADAASTSVMIREITNAVNEWVEELPPELHPQPYDEATMTGSITKQEWTRSEILRLFGIVRVKHGAVHDALYEDLIRLDPDDATLYYSRAHMYAVVGEYEKALADMRRGNALPRHGNLAGFPRTAYVEALLRGDARLAARLYPIWHDYRIDPLQLVNLLVEDLPEVTDAETNQTLYDFLCRFALMPENDAWAIESTVRRIGSATSQMAEQHDIESPEGVVLSELQTELGNIADELDVIQAHSPHGNLLHNDLGFMIRSMIGRPDLGTYMRAQVDDALEQMDLIEQGIRPRIERIAEFDWHTLRWPEAAPEP